MNKLILLILVIRYINIKEIKILKLLKNEFLMILIINSKNL